MKVLFLTHRLPYAPNRGDRIRAYHIVDTLRTFADVRIASLVHSRDELARADDMRRRGLAVETGLVNTLGNRVRAGLALAGRRPLTHLLLNAAGFDRTLTKVASEWLPDVVLAYCSGMARFGLEPPLAGLPLVVDLVDVDSAKWSDLAARTSGPARWIYAREARCLARFERRAAAAAATTLVVNTRERDALLTVAPDARVDVVPNGIDLAAFRPPTPPASAPRVIFCGVMNYAPNTEGVEWFATEVWPRVRAVRPDAVFSIVGSDPSAAVRALASDGNGIEVTGTVPRVEDYLWQAAVSVAPLRIARGLQNKVLEALAAGLPTVVTSQVANGLPPEAAAGCVTADDPDAFANAVVALLRRTPDARRTMAWRAQLEPLAWSRQLAPLRDHLLAAIARARAIS